MKAREEGSVERLSKSQIDRLGNRLKSGDLEEANVRLLDTYRRSFGGPYEVVVRSIRGQLALDPTGRPAKSTSAIVEKLQRESIRLSQIQDIAGCRIVVADVVRQNDAVRRLLQTFPDSRIIDRRATPSHGYRAVHFIPTIDGVGIEVQVRTSLQHLWSEFSEKLSDVIDPSVKYGGGSDEIRAVLEKTSEFVGRIERQEYQLFAAIERVSELSPGEVETMQAEHNRIKSELGSLLRDLAAQYTGRSI